MFRSVNIHSLKRIEAIHDGNRAAKSIRMDAMKKIAMISSQESIKKMLASKQFRLIFRRGRLVDGAKKAA